jgi:hypothetical protein
LDIRIKNKKSMTPNWMQSSIDPTKVSATVTGTILMASGAIIYIAQWVNFPLSQSDVASLAASFGMAAGLVTAVFGLFRKLLVRASA